MGSLFSIFDPVSSFMFYSANWVSVVAYLLFLPSKYSPLLGKFFKLFFKMKYYIVSEFILAMGSVKTPGVAHFLVSFFLLIMFSNFLGLFPYVFTASSHLSMTVALALPVWSGYMLFSSLKNINFLLAHLVPLGTPYVLMPFMVLIEIVSSLIRPITLSVRLAANMTAGHLLMVLVSSPMVIVSWGGVLGVSLPLLLLVMLELAVSFIQAYVFSTLMFLYIIEVNSPHF